MARRKEVRLPADWICDSPAVTALSCAEFGVLTWLIAEKQRWFPEGRFIEEGRVFSLRMLAERSPHRGSGALGCLHGLQSAGFLIREADGAFRLVEKWRQEEAEDACDEPVLSKVHDASPLSPITPIPPTQKSKEKRGRGCVEDWERLLTDKLRSAKPIATAWASWVSHVAGLMRLTEEKLRQDVRRMTEIHEDAGEEALVSAMTWAVSCGYRTITKEPKSRSRNKPKDSQPSASDEGDGFSSRHRPNVL